MVERVPYDEFSMFHENASEYGIPFDAPPVVDRKFVEVSPGRRLSALLWGVGDPSLVFLHGGAQNAHTWDTVALALGVPLVCIDLPGHGHSDSAAAFDPVALPLQQNAADIATVVRTLAPNARAVVGMSLGGLTSLALSRDTPDLVRRLVLVDITPGVNQEKAKQITDFVNGPATFPSFEELLERTIQFNPTRTVASLRRGILHNAVQLDDLTWRWRYDRRSHPSRPGRERIAAGLWEVLEATKCPVALVRGALSPVVDDADVAEFLRRRPDAVVHLVDGAGHSVQGDRPRDMARIIRDMLP